MRKKNKGLALPLIITLAAAPVAAAPADVITAGEACKAQVAAIWAQRGQVALSQHKDFSLALGQASEQCEQLSDLAHKVREAEKNLQAYQAALSRAQGMPGSASGTPSAYPAASEADTHAPVMQVPAVEHSGVTSEAQLLGEAPAPSVASSPFPKGPNDGKVKYAKP
ncbi:MAG: hypothetical protein ACK5O7_02990 [Holosporales bacterium]